MKGLFSDMFTRNGGGGDTSVGMALMLAELRDIRSSMTSYQSNFDQRMSGLQEQLSEVHRGVIQAQTGQDALRNDVDKLSDTVILLDRDVTHIKSSESATSTSWEGPKRVAKALVLTAASLGALAVIGKVLGPVFFPGFELIPAMTSVNP